MRKLTLVALAIASAFYRRRRRLRSGLGAPNSDVDYHAEGQITLGGNIQIQTDRAPDQGQALTRCDPDPRPAPHARPDCQWATPTGSGREEVGLPGQIGRPDTDTSPNGSFTPNSRTPARSSTATPRWTTAAAGAARASRACSSATRTCTSA